MIFLKKVLIIFFIVALSNLVIELIFEKSIENLLSLKFFIVSILVSLFCGVVLKKRDRKLDIEKAYSVGMQI